MLVIVAVYFLKIYSYDLRNTISLKDGSITMRVAPWRVSPAALTTIRVGDIGSIERETFDIRTIAA